MLQTTIRLTVDQDTVEQARLHQRAEDYDICSQCLMAVALNRATGLKWQVGCTIATIRLDDLELVYNAPPEAQDAIKKFDDLENPVMIDPFECDFILDGACISYVVIGKFLRLLSTYVKDVAFQNGELKIAGDLFEIENDYDLIPWRCHRIRK